MDSFRSILILDDEPLLLRMMSLYLERRGYAVKVAGSAAEARAELAADRHDAVVMDATLAGTTLMELGGEILGDPGIRLLVVSGYPVDMRLLDRLAPGRAAFLHKPFAPEMLAESLRRLLGEKAQGV